MLQYMKRRLLSRAARHRVQDQHINIAESTNHSDVGVPDLLDETLYIPVANIPVALEAHIDNFEAFARLNRMGQRSVVYCM